jgi:endoglucanase
MAFFIDFLKRNNFNAVRLPFSAEVALNFDTLMVDGVSADASFAGKTAGQAKDLIVSGLTQAGILVMPDLHVFKASDSLTDGWYSDQYPAEKIIQAWRNIASRYKSNPGVFAADLKNEPHGAMTWDLWMDGAAQISRAIHEVNPNMLLVIEGVSDAKYTSGKWGGFWGGIVKGALSKIPDPSLVSKFVYSPHAYGPSVHVQDYFKTGDFPNNMPAIWEDHFGAVVGKYPVVIGEWGGRYVDQDRVWQDKFSEWLISKGLGCSNFYWSLNPNSGDTGGILLDDWKTPNQDKIDMLTRTCPSPTKFQI